MENFNPKEGDVVVFRCGGKAEISKVLTTSIIEVKFKDELTYVKYQIDGDRYHSHSSVFDIVDIIGIENKQPRTLKELLDNGNLQTGMQFENSECIIEVCRTEIGWMFQKLTDASSWFLLYGIDNMHQWKEHT